MAPLSLAFALPLSAALFLLTGCPQKQATSDAALPGPSPTGTLTAAQATQTAVAAALTATAEAGLKAAADAAIAQAEKDIEAARKAKCPYLVPDLYKEAVGLLASARAAYKKPDFNLAREQALAASAKALEALKMAKLAGAGGYHVVKKGHNLWKIAKRRLKDPFLWPLLHEANSDLIQNPHKIEIGWKLVVPKKWTDEEAQAAREKAYAEPKR